MPSLKIKQQQQQTKPKTTMSSLFRGRFTRGRSSLRGSTRAGSANSSANRKKIARTRRKVQLKGGHRVTESLRIKPNRLFFDHTAGHIVDRRKWLKSVYSFGPKVKVIGEWLKLFLVFSLWNFKTSILQVKSRISRMSNWACRRPTLLKSENSLKTATAKTLRNVSKSSALTSNTAFQSSFEDSCAPSI